MRVVIVGAGFGGLAAALELLRAGVDVTVLEAHIYAGGCAGTFYHQKYRFDAGATLAGGFAPGAPMQQLGERFGIDWEVRLADEAMTVYLPDGEKVRRWMDGQRWQEERRRAFGEDAELFWQWQERTADHLWDFAQRLPAWPPQNFRNALHLVKTGMDWGLSRWQQGQILGLPGLAADAFRPVSSHLGRTSAALRQFVDGQLLISAQTTSSRANALYGAAALDLPRLGVGYVPGGMGGMAEKMVEAIRRMGGRVFFCQEVKHVRLSSRQVAIIKTARDSFPADQVIFNLPPWNIAPLLDGLIPGRLRRLPPLPEDAWGAFVLYLGVDGGILDEHAGLHYQVISRQPLGEANTAFLSFSPAWDARRAPAGRRALTVSTHTRLAPWWSLYENAPQAYEQRKAEYMARLLETVEIAFPGLRDAADLVMPGTPVTFERFTHRARGWVGGFPQTHLLRNWGPRLGQNLWMVGDTIFPGQSVPAVTLGGLRVANALLQSVKLAPITRPVMVPLVRGE